MFVPKFNFYLKIFFISQKLFINNIFLNIYFYFYLIKFNQNLFYKITNNNYYNYS